MGDTQTLAIPDSWDGDTIRAASTEIESYLDYEDQTDRLDDRTREGLVIALEVLADVAKAYDAKAGS